MTLFYPHYTGYILSQSATIFNDRAQRADTQRRPLRAQRPGRRRGSSEPRLRSEMLQSFLLEYVGILLLFIVRYCWLKVLVVPGNIFCGAFYKVNCAVFV
jgi:hypothetical protein